MSSSHPHELMAEWAALERWFSDHGRTHGHYLGSYVVGMCTILNRMNDASFVPRWLSLTSEPMFPAKIDALAPPKAVAYMRGPEKLVTSEPVTPWWISRGKRGPSCDDTETFECRTCGHREFTRWHPSASCPGCSSTGDGEEKKEYTRVWLTEAVLLAMVAHGFSPCTEVMNLNGESAVRSILDKALSMTSASPILVDYIAETDVLTVNEEQVWDFKENRGASPVPIF